MIAATLTLLMSQDTLKAEDFFPLKPGTKWVYEQIRIADGKKTKSLVTDTVLPEATVQKEAVKLDDGTIKTFPKISAIPIKTTMSGYGDAFSYHQIVDNQIMIVALDEKVPQEKPYCILKVAEKGVKWSYVGEVNFYNENVPMSFTAEMKRIGTRTVLDQKVEVIEVKMDTLVQGTPDLSFRTIQTAVYAKGIGLVESESVTIINDQKEEFKRKLIQFTPG